MRALIFVAALSGCEENFSKTTSDPNWGNGVSVIEYSGSVAGDLAEGQMLSSLDWADDSSVACWPGTEDLNWSGSHVFYAMDQPSNSKLTATVDPDDAYIDVNVYILQQGTGDHQVPPEVSSVVSCEAGFPQSTDSNPGEEDSAYTIATSNEYNVLIGVAGPEGVTSGGYTLTIQIEDY